MTIQESLLTLTPYPIPDAFIETVVLNRGLDAIGVDEETEDESVSEPEATSSATSLNADILNSRAYKLAKADIYMWLSVAPNISQGGQSYGFSADEKKQFLRWANTLYMENGEKESAKSVYGYKGSRL